MIPLHSRYTRGCQESREFGVVRAIACFVVALAAASGVNCARATENSPRTIDNVAAAVCERHHQIRQLLVDVYMTTENTERVSTDRYLVALGPERLFLDFMHNTSRTDEPWHDIDRFRLWMTPEFKGYYKPFARALFLEPGERAEMYWDSTYGDSIGWHPAAQHFLKKRGEVRFYLSDVFAPHCLEDLTLHNDLEDVSGMQCVHVSAKSGRDEVWLAPSSGYALVKRHLKGEQDLRRTITCTEFEEVAAAIWLPRQIDVETVVASGSQQQLVRRFHLDVHHLAVNSDVPESIFEFRPGPGTVTYNGSQQVVSFQQGGQELLDLWAAFSMRQSQALNATAAPWPPVVYVAMVLVPFASVLASLVVSKVLGKSVGGCGDLTREYG